MPKKTERKMGKTSKITYKKSARTEKFYETSKTQENKYDKVFWDTYPPDEAISSWAEIVTDVSKRSNAKRDIVELILNSYKDVLVDHIVNRGRVNILGIINIKVFGKKINQGNNVASKGNNQNKRVVNINYGLRIPVLKPTINKKILDLWKTRRDVFKGDRNIITKNNWKDIPEYFTVKKYYDPSLTTKVIDDNNKPVNTLDTQALKQKINTTKQKIANGAREEDLKELYQTEIGWSTQQPEQKQNMLNDNTEKQQYKKDEKRKKLMQHKKEQEDNYNPLLDEE